jgi:hypothetical protein
MRFMMDPLLVGQRLPGVCGLDARDCVGLRGRKQFFIAAGRATPSLPHAQRLNLVGNFWMTAIGLSDGWSGIDRASAAAKFRVIHPK